MAKKKEMCSLENHESGAGIVLMKLEELHSFEGHPFKVERNQELFELRCSIEKEGVLVPLLVRKNPHGDGYEIISGHRRKEAALWAGLTKVPVIIRELDDDQSVIAMIDSNLQREKILPSEKAFAYKMRLEAMKHQGRLESDTSDPLEPKCKTELVNVSELEAELQKLGKVKIQKKGGAEGKRSNEQLASMVGESVTQIKRYIRLTHLIPNLTYKSGEQMEQLGKYGFLRRDYLKNHRNSTYQVMLLQDTIGEHLLEVDKAARQREEVISLNKKFLKHYMETNPEGTAQTYIFLVDNQDIALNIVMSGYQALCLVQEDDGYYFSADSFIEEMRAIQFTGSCQSAYHYVTACTVKWMNDKLQTFFKDAGLDGKTGWQLFKEKEYLGKLDNQKEVEKLLEQYILRFERDPKEEPELSRFHLFDAKGNVKGVRDMEIVDYLVENVQFFVVGITPYYYEHGVFLEDHDGVRMKYRIQKLIYRDQVQSGVIKRIYNLLITQPKVHREAYELNSGLILKMDIMIRLRVKC